ncbi:MAG: glycosyltransferase family 87 protein [Pseudomonadota bacterium]
MSEVDRTPDALAGAGAVAEAEAGAAARDLREAAWLDGKRAASWLWFGAVGVVVMAIGSLYSSYVNPELFGKIFKPPDYMAFWTASVVMMEQGAAATYDWAATHAVMLETLGVETIGGILPWNYPPHALPFISWLGLGHPAWMMVVWVALQVSIFLWICWRILPHRLTILGAFLTAPMLITLVTGQAGLYWAVLLALAIEYRRSHPVLSGLALGFATMKPHLFVPLPLAFLAERTVMALVWASVTLLALVALTTLVGGFAVWEAWIGKLEATTVTHTSDTADYRLTASVFSYLRSWLVPIPVAGAVHAGLALPCVAIMVVVWASPRMPEDLKAAVLCFALFAAGPRTMIYEMGLLYVGILYQLRYALAHGFFPYEKIMLVALGAFNVMSMTKVPGVFPAFPYILLLALFFGRCLPILRSRAAIS